MGNDNQSAIKIIIAVGLLAAVFLFLLAISLRSSMEPREEERVQLGMNYSAFDYDRAMEDIAYMESLGPRPSVSEALNELRSYLLSELADVGLEVRQYPFVLEADSAVTASDGEGVNLVAVVEGDAPGVVLVGAHYDSKVRSDIEFVGTNQSASGAAWLLEMARLWGPERSGRSLWLVWFDGHEAVDEAITMPALQGSQALVAQLEAEQRLSAIDAMIYVGQIGDCYLNISRDEGAPAWLWEQFEETATRLGYRKHFSQRRQGFLGDFKAFREAGTPALALVDFVYGGSILNHSNFWHTEEDRIDKLCGESLRAVADVMVHALPGLERRLDEALEGED